MSREIKKILLLIDEQEFYGARFGFNETLIPSDDHEDEDIKTFGFKSDPIKLPPHADFVNGAKALRKIGLELLNIELASPSTQINKWHCFGVEIKGNIQMQQSRARLIMGVYNDLYKTYNHTKTNWVTMYPKDDDKVKFPRHKELTAGIETLLDQGYQYINGKFDTDLDYGPLFTSAAEKVEE